MNLDCHPDQIEILPATHRPKTKDCHEYWHQEIIFKDRQGDFSVEMYHLDQRTILPPFLSEPKTVPDLRSQQMEFNFSEASEGE